MDLLPKEMLLEIFKYLQAHDLLSLTEVCSTFNHLISSTEKLLDKIPITLQLSQSRTDSMRSLFTDISKLIVDGLKFGNRRYTKVIVCEIKKDISVKICELLNENVKEMTFRRGSHSIETVRRILMACKNVKMIKFCRKSVRSDDDRIDGPLPQLKIRKLYLENIGSQVFQVLRESSVETLECTIGRRICQHEFIPEELGYFLTLQTSLKVLKLERIAWNINDIFDGGNLPKIKFKLESLSLNDVLIDESQIFTNFMQLHLDSLVKLELVRIEGFNFSKILQQSVNLSKLKSINTWLDIYKPLPNVQKLEIEYPHVIKMFPNIKQLTISCTQFSPYQIHLWNEYFENLGQLVEVEVGNLSLLNFPKIPTLKKLRLKNVERIYVEVFYENPQIEELVIEKREGLIMRYDYEVDFISCELPNLILLEIVGGKVCRRYLDLAKERCKKLKFLRLIDVDVVAS